MARVVVVRTSDTPAKRSLSAGEYHNLLAVGLRALADTDLVDAALKKLVVGGNVGMKTNCVAHRFNSTSVELVQALGDLLEKAGWPPHNLVIWERTSRELKQAGFELNASSFGRRCLGTDACPGTYGRTFYSSGEVSSLVSNVLTELVDRCIDLPVLKDHSIAGLSGALKNWYGAINNPNKYHDNNCDPYAAHVFNLEPIRDRHCLTIIEAIQVQYQNGPGYDAGYLHSYGGLIISADAVAADSVGLTILEQIRRSHGLPSLEEAGRPARYLSSAAALGLGVSDLSMIQLDVLAVDSQGRTAEGVLF